ncbi:MAG: MFS transporter, partial [Acidimicrobiales bacterium]|nr:MFS transporter [Acidimicrobiales bacterium]
LGVASGPSLGAFAISLSDWRAAFWINLPICALLLAASRSALSESARNPTKTRPDYAGAALISAALGGATLGISRSEVWGWADARTLGSIAAGLAIIVVFVARQRTHPEPILDLTLFQSRSFSIANFSGLAFFAGFAALGLNNVLFLRQAWGYDVLTAGLLSAVAPATVALLSPVTGRLASRFGFRTFVVAGPLLVAALMLVFVVVFDETTRPWLFMALGQLVAAGIAMFIPVNSAASVADLPAQRLSVGGAVNNTFRQVGSALGIAVLVAVIGSPVTTAELVDAHRAGWVMIATTMLLAALVGLRQIGATRTAD